MRDRDAEIKASAFADAFQRNCPDARLTSEEADELARLFEVAIKYGRSPSHSEAA